MFEKVKDCFGCGVCVAVCPTGALSFELDAQGFYVPVLSDGCIDCDLCRRCCAALKRPATGKLLASWAMRADDYVRRGCSSGGAAFEIARAHGGAFCGVRYDALSKKTEHFVGDPAQARGSKYLSSDSAAGLRSALKQGGMITGTPCQIASLRRHVGDDERFLLVDFFCHGVPSMLLWHQYLADHPALAAADTVHWRDKGEGWHRSLRLRGLLNGETVHLSERSDLFFKFFLRNYVSRAECYECPFRFDHSAADVRVGDLWSKKYADDELGVSAVVAFTPRGQRVVEKLRGMEPVDFAAVAEGQIEGRLHKPSLRKRLLRELARGHSLRKIYRHWEWLMRLERKLWM